MCHRPSAPANLAKALRRGRRLHSVTLRSAQLARCWKKLAALVCRSNPPTGALNCTNANVAQVSHQIIPARTFQTVEVATAKQILERSAFLQVRFRLGIAAQHGTQAIVDRSYDSSHLRRYRTALGRQPCFSVVGRPLLLRKARCTPRQKATTFKLHSGGRWPSDEARAEAHAALVQQARA